MVPAAGGRTGLLLRELLATAPRVEPGLVARLVAAARGSGRADWPLRRCAALMLEHLFWVCDSPAGEALVLSHLGRDASAIDPVRLRRRVARNARVHARLRGSATTPEAVAEFVRLAERDSRLTLAPWLFTADEVADRITGRLRSSRAVIQPLPEVPEVAAEAERALAGLPEWERSIAAALAYDPRAFWVPLKPNRLEGDLVAFPPETVVLTVNPPGSDLEIEIKRTGRPARRPLKVVWERDGKPVPPSHRLDGGSMWDLLRFEAVASARFSAIWRAIHGEEAPICRTVAVKAAYALPDGKRELPVLDYFRQEAARSCMPRVVRAYCEEHEDDAPLLDGELALAARFLLHASPAQSVLVGTTAHRLDKVAAALRKPDAFPADLLDEVLVLFETPEETGLDAVFSLPSNRRRADAYRRAAATRLGSLWGTFLALGVGSCGESLVSRNVGLKAVFRGGEWTVELISMDHDNLRIAARDDRTLDPAAVLEANVKDEIALFGGMYKGARVAGSLELVDEIYRADDARRAETRAELFAAARAAFVRSVDALEPGSAAAKMFSRAYLDELRQWRRAVTRFLSGGRARYPVIEQHGDFLRRHAAIWLGGS
jgi:hypothetical protein